MQQVRDQVFDEKVESVSKACRKPARTCRKPGCKPGRKPGLQLARIMECGNLSKHVANIDPPLRGKDRSSCLYRPGPPSAILRHYQPSIWLRVISANYTEHLVGAIYRPRINTSTFITARRSSTCIRRV